MTKKTRGKRRLTSSSANASAHTLLNELEWARTGGATGSWRREAAATVAAEEAEPVAAGDSHKVVDLAHKCAPLA